MPEQDFLYDDFFFPANAPGVPTTIEVRGIQIPIELKKGISTGDYQYAKNKSVKLSYHTDGSASIDSVDDDMFGRELIKRCLKKWPFKLDGNMVEINDQNLNDVDPAVSQALLKKITGIISAVQKGLDGPFVQPSAEA